MALAQERLDGEVARRPDRPGDLLGRHHELGDLPPRFLADRERGDPRVREPIDLAARGRLVLLGRSFGPEHLAGARLILDDMPIAAFSPRKTAHVLYIGWSFLGAEDLFARLGKYTTGKGCLYIKKLADVDAKVLEALLAKSVEARRERLAPTEGS